MKVRKCFSRMPQPEREAFLAALLRIKNKLANPLEEDVSKHISVYDQFVLIHNAANSQIRLNGGTAVDPAHLGSAFGPWHREFLIRFELELQKEDPNVMLPYWDWTDLTGNTNIVFNHLGMGPNGDPLSGGLMPAGYFTPVRPGTPGNPTGLPAWYPLTMNGWHCDPRLVEGAAYNNLRRYMDPIGSLAGQSLVRATLNTPTTPMADDAAYMAFRLQLEGGLRMHNYTHNWFGIGSHMRNRFQSPNDPIFFLHHCNCDRLWAMWQMDGHEGYSFYPVAGGLQGHNLPDPMWPWIGGIGGYTSSYINADASFVLPDYLGETPRTAVDVMYHRNIMLNGVNRGYSYDTQVVVGIALDRSGSMMGPTPDPLSGMPPNITKWDAAKLGVGHFLQDAEAVYQAAESYVVGGVNTFRNNMGTNEVLPVSSAVPKYGLIKTGSPYAQAAFDADIAVVNAQGGTPLAAALSQTEDDLVRPPFNNRPDAEQRYLCIMTDGIETSPPLLTTLGTPEFPDTIIFGLGYGTGEGWNGVDYTTIATLVSKGKGAPVEQVFHGDNANIINKFYTNSIAHTIGFEPETDPRYEIFPGEMVKTAFEVTCGDQAYMISVQGFDFNDKHWSFYVFGPDGQVYKKSVETPYLITMVRRDARLTIFLNRNHGPAVGWEGRWTVVSIYMPDAKEVSMYMASDRELLIHAGAPPLLGPRFTRFNQPAAKRLSVRIMEPKPNERHPHSRAFTSGNPATVAVNIYSKGLVSAKVKTHVQKPFAGNSIELAVRLNDLAYGSIKFMRVTGRLIAPNFSVGNILLDFKTISKSKRKKYYQKKDDEGTFDVLNYLADYEKAKPGVFDMRDEFVEFRKDENNTWKAIIKNTRFPGLYQFGIQVEGAIVRDNGCVERVWRVLNNQVALGIQPTVEKTRPTLTWLAPDRFVVRFIAIDELGNIAVPSFAGAVQLLYNRQPIEFVSNESEDGAFELEVKVVCGKGAKFDRSGQWFDGPVRLNTPCDGPIEIKRGTPLKFSVRIGSTVLPVTNQVLGSVGKKE